MLMAASVLARWCLLVLVQGLAYTQTTSQIVGTVRDGTGAVIPKALVEVLGESQGLRKMTESNAEGLYVLVHLPPDRYRLRVAVAGFKDFTTTVELGVAQARHVDAPMRLDTETTVIEVVAGNGMVDTSSARAGSNVTSREVQEIPLNGRTYALLSLTAPGATNTGDGAFDKLRFNGKATEQNKFAYDGIDASGVFDAAPGWLTVSGSQFRLQNSVETIQEFRVDSALYPAEYGTGTGGQIQLVSKSGGNRFHGALFEYFRNDRLDARNFFDADEKSRLRLNQFGANLGGPILTDRLFFFGSFETLRQRAGMNVLETVPSAAARERAVPEIRPLLRTFPAGSLPTSNLDMDIAQRSDIARLDETNFSGRIDWHLSSTQRLYVRYLKDVGTLETPDNTVTARNLQATNKPDHFVASLNSTLSSSTVNELKFGINRAPTTLSVDADAPELFATAINITGMTVQPGVNGGASSGVASPGGITRQSSAGNGRGSEYRGKSFTLLDNVSHVSANHQIKAGVEFRAIRVPIRQLGGLTYSFSNLDDFLANRAASASFIGDLDVHVGEQEYYIGYVQNEWRARPAVTFNYGVRYEYYTVNRERESHVRLFDAGQVRLLDPSTPMFRSDKLALAPRFGLTWAPVRLKNRTVFRIGSGIYFGPGQYEDQIQPIESDVDRFHLTGQRYPLNLAALAAGPPPPQSPRAFDVSGYRLPEKNVQYGASIQQQLAGQFVGQVGYVGSLGRNLFQRSITNLIVAVDTTTGRVARQNPEFGEIDYKTSGGRDTYNALHL
ncbi:MAG TPA: TonB-dependent receptor, partial [Bryobacteraceae bacterium]|nr:TonB-dependent receptor [Bryobacteraceae bacterium]